MILIQQPLFLHYDPPRLLYLVVLFTDAFAFIQFVGDVLQLRQGQLQCPSVMVGLGRVLDQVLKQPQFIFKNKCFSLILEERDSKTNPEMERG